MRVKPIIISVILMFLLSCSAHQKQTMGSRHQTIEKFDMISFESKKIKDGEIYSEVKGDSVVEISTGTDVFMKNTYAVNRCYINKKSYFKENYQLKAEVNFFHKFPVGISKKYNREGELIEKKNWDEKYAFSVSQLIEKMRTEFNVDLLNYAKVGVDRGFENNNYLYIIILRDEIPTNQVREIKISGSDGTVVLDTIKYLQKY